MKKLILLAVILISTFGFSQTQTRDVVYLKNGSIIKGQIKEMNPSESLKIETGDGSLFVYKMSEILKMEKETTSRSNEININNTSIESLTESKAKEVINALFTDVSLSESIKVVGVSEWNSELRKENSEFRYILGKVELNVIIYGKLKVEHASTTFKFKRIDGEWYVKDISSSFRGYAYTPYRRWARGIYEKVSDVKTGKQIIRQKESLINKHKSEENWKNPDKSELTLNPIYLKASDVPLFKDSNNKFSIDKLLGYCDNCRNDNIMLMEKTMNKVAYDTNRYSTISEAEFKNSLNNSKIEIYVKNISFKHKGTNKNGINNGFSCSIDYLIFLKSNFERPQVLQYEKSILKFANSNNWDIHVSKEKAFSSALLDFERQFRKTIIKYEPLSLKVESIKLDKKGNPEYLILENSKNFFTTKKISFYIIKESSLKVKNGKFNAGVVLGKITYKKSDSPNQIKIKIKKNKVKKALRKYIGNESMLIGVSSE